MCALATGAARADGDFLDPEGAFALAVRAVDATRIELRFDVAPGYHLYRDKVVASTDPAGILAPIALPRGSVEHDATFAKDVEVFRGVVKAELPVARADAAFRLVVSHQGCADAGLCYSPVAHAFRVEPDATGLRVVALLDSDATAAQQASSGGTARRAIAAPAPADDGGNGFAGALHSRRLVRVALVFAFAGLLLSLTPCVLPMVPILASIIVGQGTVSRARGFLLAASYALGMALVYTAFGTAAGLAGEGLAAALQNGWTLGAFALLLAALSLSMFGLYEVQMPSALQTRLAQLSSRLRGGHHLGVFAMGGASALVVGPCVAAPLAGALLYISQTRDVAIGGVALFSLAAGMSVPLLLVGVSAGSLLPRAGAWMERVKHVFGALLLAIALWTVSPVLPAWATLVAVAALLLAAAAYLGAFERSSDGALSPPRALVKSVALMLACGALLELVGVASGGNDALRPLRPLAVAAAAQARSSGAVSTVAFRAVEDLDALEREVRASPRPVMIDVYADWCVACKELETLTFADDAVREQLAKMTLLRVDVSANSAADRALLRRHGLFGPPALLFFAPAGDELAASRVIGFENAASLRERLDRVVAATVASRGGQE
ncbi:MAG: protein-disulfide reductase DsbD [Rhizobacter sp.]|nr:protein-disulfide reductase DsbD [Rhizobacter sp.]